MNITFDSARRVFTLDCAEMSYAIAIADNGRLVNLYWGSAVPEISDYDDVRGTLVKFGGPMEAMRAVRNIAPARHLTSVCPAFAPPRLTAHRRCGFAM